MIYVHRSSYIYPGWQVYIIRPDPLLTGIIHEYQLDIRWSLCLILTTVYMCCTQKCHLIQMCHAVYAVVLDERGRSEYATFASTGMAGAVSCRRFKVVAYAGFGLVEIAEVVAGGKMTSSYITLAGERETQGVTTHIYIDKHHEEMKEAHHSWEFWPYFKLTCRCCSYLSMLSRRRYFPV